MFYLKKMQTNVNKYFKSRYMYYNIKTILSYWFWILLNFIPDIQKLIITFSPEITKDFVFLGKMY